MLWEWKETWSLMFRSPFRFLDKDGLFFFLDRCSGFRRHVIAMKVESLFLARAYDFFARIEK